MFCGWCDPTSGTSLYTGDGSTFELDSFQLGGNPNATDIPWTGTVTGYLDGGGIVSKALNVDAEPPQLITFGSTWSNLVSVDIQLNVTDDGHDAFDTFSIDNVSVQAVPVPAAVWLFGSGLGLLGWLRRRS